MEGMMQYICPWVREKQGFGPSESSSAQGEVSKNDDEKNEQGGNLIGQNAGSIAYCRNEKDPREIIEVMMQYICSWVKEKQGFSPSGSSSARGENKDEKLNKDG